MNEPRVHIFRFHGLAPAQYVSSFADHEDAQVAANALDESYPTCYHAIIPVSWVEREDNGEI